MSVAESAPVPAAPATPTGWKVAVVQTSFNPVLGIGNSPGEVQAFVICAQAPPAATVRVVETTATESIEEPPPETTTTTTTETTTTAITTT
jgi:hypothetical protein